MLLTRLQLSSGEFAKDLEGCAISEGFPTSDKDTIVKWTTSIQGFQITEERARPLTIILMDFGGSGLGCLYLDLIETIAVRSLFSSCKLRDDLGEKDICDGGRVR